MATITKQQYPALYWALELLHRDNGVNVPEVGFTFNATEEQLTQINSGISSLSQDDLEEFVMGEVSNAYDISCRLPELRLAHSLLDLYFNTL